MGQHDGLDAVAEVELLQDVGDMRLDGSSADVEFVDAEQAVAEVVAGRVAASVVADLDLEPVSLVADDDIGVVRAGVSERVGQALWTTR